MASLADVAKAAGVSITTASFVLNGHAADKRIAPQTAARVLEAVRDLGYVPNMAAKKLTDPMDRRAVVPDIAFMWSPAMHYTILGPFITNAQDIFDRELVTRMNIIVSPFAEGFYHNARADFLDRRFNGAFFSPMTDEELDYVHSLTARIPVVVLHTRTPHLSNVIMDNDYSGRTAARVFAAGGHRSAAMLYRSQIGSTSLPDERASGFRAGCQELGLACTGEAIPPEVMRSTLHRSRYGREYALRCLAEGTLPEAIFIQDDAMALGFAAALREKGVRIPEDLELITFGMDDLTEASAPSITAVDYPASEMALQALMLMEAELLDPYASPKQILVRSTITFRESCPRPKGWEP